MADDSENRPATFRRRKLTSRNVRAGRTVGVAGRILDGLELTERLRRQFMGEKEPAEQLEEQVAKLTKALETQQRREAAGSSGYVCPMCKKAFEPNRSDQSYCSPKCRKRSSRERVEGTS